MTRQLRLLLIGICSLSFGLVIIAAESPRPNIVLILADDLGYSDLGCYGGEIKTPNLDRLAQGGIRYRQFYNTTRCCPSRASINTGLYPHQAGIGLMDGHSDRRGYEGYLTDRCVTLAQILKSAGYRTYMSGKWHMNPNTGPIDRGFDEYFGLLHGHSSSSFDPKAHVRLPEGRPLREYPPDQYYATDVFTDYALDFLAESRKPNGKGERPPFFLYIAHTAPHFPLHAPKEEIGKYAETYLKGWDVLRKERFTRQKNLGVIADNIELTPRSKVPKNWSNKQTGWADKVNPAWNAIGSDRRADLARRMAIFAAMIDRMDKNVDRVINDLEKHGDLDNTLIIFLSDNGACAEWDPWGFDIDSGPKNVLHRGEELEKMGGPGTYHSTGSGWANVANTPWRLYKHYVHEGGIRTPMIVHWSKGINRKGVFENSVGHVIDLMPTFIELSGATYPTEWNGKPIIPMEGRSLVKSFEGKQNEQRTLYWEHEGNRGVREGDLKLVRINTRNDWELYDLKTDPTELNDLAEQQPENVRRLSEAWDVWARRAFVIENIDTTLGLKFELDFSQQELKDISGKNNKVTLEGELPIEQKGRRFDRKSYISVPHSDSLHCAETAWTVEAVILPDADEIAKDGVILARGGIGNGYSLALREGKPIFSITVDGERFVLQGTAEISGRSTLTGKIDAKRQTTLEVNGKEVARLRLPRWMHLPNEGMQIGRDLETQVNEGRLPGFLGVIEQVRIYRGVPEM